MVKKVGDVTCINSASIGSHFSKTIVRFTTSAQIYKFSKKYCYFNMKMTKITEFYLLLYGLRSSIISGRKDRITHFLQKIVKLPKSK